MLELADGWERQWRLQERLIRRAGMLLGSLPQKQRILEGVELRAAPGCAERRCEGARQLDCAAFRDLPKLTIFPAHCCFRADNDFVDIGGTRDQRWIICHYGRKGCPGIGYHIQVVEESKGRAVPGWIGEERIVVDGKVRIARRRRRDRINGEAGRAAPPICHAGSKDRGKAAAQTVPGDQDGCPLWDRRQKCFQAFSSVLRPQYLPEPDGGTERDLRCVAGAGHEFVVGNHPEHCEVFDPIEPEREIAAADADRELPSLAVARGIEQVAAVGVESRSPDNPPGWVSRLVEGGVDFADHLLLGGGPVLIDVGERTERHRKLGRCGVVGCWHGPYSVFARQAARWAAVSLGGSLRQYRRCGTYAEGRNREPPCRI